MSRVPRQTIRFLPLFVLLGSLLFQHIAFTQSVGDSGTKKYVELGNPRYRIHDLSQLGSGYRTIQFDQDRFDRLYVVSGGSIFTFDGNNWKSFLNHSENPYPIVGLALSKDGIFYAGGNGIWGTLEWQDTASLGFVPCKDSDDPNHRRIQEDMFDVQAFPDGNIGFMSHYSYVLMDTSKRSRVFEGFYRLSTQFYLNGDVYLCSEREGISRIRNGELKRMDHFILPDNAFVTSSCVLGDGQVLLGLSNGGLYAFDGESVYPFVTNFDIIKKYRVNDVEIIEDQYIAIALDSWGLVIVDFYGEFVNSISRKSDPRFINVSSLNYGNGSLWAAVSSGLAQIFFPSPMMLFDHSQGLVMSWPSVYRYKGKLVLRSKRMIFEGVYDENGMLQRFQKMGFPAGNRAVDAVLTTEEGILFSDKTGIFLRLDNGEIETLTNEITSNFLKLHPDNPDILFSINSEGVYFLRRENDRWVYNGDFFEVPGANNQVFYIDREGCFWVERGIGCVVRFWIEDDELKGRVFDYEDGFHPYWVSMYSLDNDTYVSNGGDHFVYDYDSDSFVLAPVPEKWETELGGVVTRPFKLPDGVYFLPTATGVVLASEKEDGEYKYDFKTFGTLSEYNPMILDSIENEIWMRTQHTLLKYDPTIKPTQDRGIRTFIQEVGVPGTKKVLYQLKNDTDQITEDIHHFEYSRNGLSFEYFSPNFERLQPLKHRFFLEGFSDDWSELAIQNRAMFTGLSEGSYSFVVEAVDHLGHVGGQTRFSFVIHPPFYRTLFAYFVYALLFILLVSFIAFVNRRSVVKENIRLEKLVGERTSSLKKAASEAEAATIAKSQFLANMSHEIRTPINGIIGSSELIAMNSMSKENRELLNMIQTSATSLVSLVEGILDFSRIEANHVELEQTEFDLETLIFECLQIVSNLSQKKRVDIFYSLDPELSGTLVGDASRIRQILINLLGNALKFTHEGHVELACKCLSLEKNLVTLEFAVNDTGVGIDLASSGDLFEPFHQVDNSNTRNFGGTGLGLAICKQLVNLMGGDIHIESEINHGTKIWFTLKFEYHSSRVNDTIQNPRSQNPMRILILDFLPERRETWVQFLKHYRHETIVAGSVEHASAKISQNGRFDCIIFEYRESPEFDEFCDYVLNLKTSGKVSQLCILAYPDVRFSRGLTQYVRNKPYAYSDILNKLTQRQHVKAVESNSTLQSQTPEETMKLLEKIRGMRVLTVEDNSVNHRVISLILNKSGIESDQAWNGQEAVDLTSKYRYDIVLMDVQMPVMDGLQATRIIKNRDNPPIVIGITANAQETDRQQALDSNMDAYLTKPIRKHALLETLASFYQVNE